LWHSLRKSAFRTIRKGHDWTNPSDQHWRTPGRNVDRVDNELEIMSILINPTIYDRRQLKRMATMTFAESIRMQRTSQQSVYSLPSVDPWTKPRRDGPLRLDCQVGLRGGSHRASLLGPYGADQRFLGSQQAGLDGSWWIFPHFLMYFSFWGFFLLTLRTGYSPSVRRGVLHSTYGTSSNI
jgi:hypothetical protein